MGGALTMMRVALAAAIAVAAPAGAQDGSEGAGQRTPESAQRFLTEFLGQGGFGAIVTLRLRDGGYGPYLATDAGDWAFTYGQVATWRGVDRCRSRIEPAGVRTNFEGPSYKYPPQYVGLDIDWSRVIKIDVTPSPANYTVRGSDGPAINRSVFAVLPTVREGHAWLPGLLFDSKEDADRVGLAMEFLRTQCAFKSDTGF